MQQSLRIAVLLGYLLVTVSAFIFTMTHFRMPGIPKIFLEWSYGMMAPYQGDTNFNDDLLAEAQFPDGTWKRISLDRYFPVGQGEKNVRKYLRSFKSSEDQVYTAKYTEFAKELLEREQARGQEISSVRLFWDEWPRSPGGFEFLHQPLFTKETLITHVP